MSGQPDLIIDDDDGSDELILVSITGPNAEVVDEDDIPDIQVFLEGPPGPPLKDINKRAQALTVTAAIPAPVFRRQRTFIVGNGGPVFNPTIASPADNGAWELSLFGTDDVNTVTLESQANLLLSGEWIGAKGSILNLQWDGQSQYVEASRNEI